MAIGLVSDLVVHVSERVQRDRLPDDRARALVQHRRLAKQPETRMSSHGRGAMQRQGLPFGPGEQLHRFARVQHGQNWGGGSPISARRGASDDDNRNDGKTALLRQLASPNASPMSRAAV